MAEGKPHARGELTSLTSLRGLAAMAVVLQHFAATYQSYCPVPFPSPVPHGYMAVDLFFSLSGFIMCYTYLDSFRGGGMRAYGPFLAKRIARIVPLNVFMIAAVSLAGLASVGLVGHNVFFDGRTYPFDLAANLLMLQGIGIGQNLNAPSWSIGAECCAYLAFPLLLALVFGRRALLCASVVVAAAGLSWLAVAHHALGQTDPVSNLTRCFTEFLLGMAAFRLFAARPGFLPRDSSAFGLAVLAAASLVLRQDLAAALVFPLLVAALAANTGLPARLLQARWIYFLGVISYSLYLVHDPFRLVALGLLTRISPHPIGPAAALILTFASSAAIIPFAWLTYSWVELPGRRRLRNLLNNPRPGRLPRPAP